MNTQNERIILYYEEGKKMEHYTRRIAYYKAGQSAFLSDFQTFGHFKVDLPAQAFRLVQRQAGMTLPINIHFGYYTYWFYF